MKRTKYILDFTEEFEKDVQDELELKRKKNSGLTTRTYYKILRLMLHGQLKDSSRPNDKNKKGAVVCFLNKLAMKAKRAVIVDNLQELIKLQPTHFTQGAYPLYKLKSDKKGATWGFQKDNLNQINFLMIDFDDQKRTPNDIIKFAQEIGLNVNLIVKSDKGYQAYFIFREALYLNSKRHDWILRSADMVANNVKKAFKNGGFSGVDEGCTNYQICRFPRRDKIEYVDINRVDDYDFYAKWSKKYSETARLPRVDGSHSGLTLIKGNLPGWARALFGYTAFEQGDRNTTTYAVALAHKDADVPVEQALTEITNWMLPQGLLADEIEHIVNSAYRGGHHAAAEYYQPIIERYGLDVQKVERVDWSKLTEAQKKRYWAKVKPAKPRAERKYSHYDERADDLLKLIAEHDGSMTISKKDLMELMGINKNSRATLNIVLEKLKNDSKIEIKKESGSKRAKLIIKLADETNQPETTEKQEEQANNEEEKYTQQKLKEDVARSLIGPSKGREYARARAVKAVGTRRYTSLIEVFITDPTAFLGSSDDLDRIRGTG